MASYAIHLAAAKIYLDRYAEENREDFFKGVIAPDLYKKPESHYGEASSAPGLEKFRDCVGLATSFNRGYYFHLKTDLLFYNDFLDNHCISNELYHDYDCLNQAVIDRYHLNIPSKIRPFLGFSKQNPQILREDELFLFIDFVGNLALEELPQPGEITYQLGRLQYEEYIKIDCGKKENALERAGYYFKRAAHLEHLEAMLLLAKLYTHHGYCWEETDLDCGAPNPFVWNTDKAKLQAERWLKKAVEKGSAKAMYMLGKLYTGPFWCNDERYEYEYPDKPEYWNEETGRMWIERAKEIADFTD